MSDVYCVFRVSASNGLADAMFAFYDDWSRASFLDSHKHMSEQYFIIIGHFVGQSRSRFEFLQDGWSCHADYVRNDENRVYCWRFSSPLLPDKSFWNLEEFLAAVHVESEVWEMANRAMR